MDSGSKGTISILISRFLPWLIRPHHLVEIAPNASTSSDRVLYTQTPADGPFGNYSIELAPNEALRGGIAYLGCSVHESRLLAFLWVDLEAASLSLPL